MDVGPNLLVVLVDVDPGIQAHRLDDPLDQLTYALDRRASQLVSAVRRGPRVFRCLHGRAFCPTKRRSGVAARRIAAKSAVGPYESGAQPCLRASTVSRETPGRGPENRGAGPRRARLPGTPGALLLLARRRWWRLLRTAVPGLGRSLLPVLAPVGAGAVALRFGGS